MKTQSHLTTGLLATMTLVASWGLAGSAMQDPPAQAPAPPPAAAAAPAPQGRGGAPQGPVVVSPDVLANRRVTFRVLRAAGPGSLVSAGPTSRATGAGRR